jgi:hypothetical protein
MHGAGWVDATLNPFDRWYSVPDIGPLTAVVVGNELELLAEPLLVYNLEVASAHTYFVEDGQGEQMPVWVLEAICGVEKWTPS